MQILRQCHILSLQSTPRASSKTAMPYIGTIILIGAHGASISLACSQRWSRDVELAPGRAKTQKSYTDFPFPAKNSKEVHNVWPLRLLRIFGDSYIALFIVVREHFLCRFADRVHAARESNTGATGRESAGGRGSDRTRVLRWDP